MFENFNYGNKALTAVFPSGSFPYQDIDVSKTDSMVFAESERRLLWF